MLKQVKQERNRAKRLPTINNHMRKILKSIEIKQATSDYLILTPIEKITMDIINLSLKQNFMSDIKTSWDIEGYSLINQKVLTPKDTFRLLSKIRRHNRLGNEHQWIETEIIKLYINALKDGTEMPSNVELFRNANIIITVYPNREMVSLENKDGTFVRPYDLASNSLINSISRLIIEDAGQSHTYMDPWEVE